MKCESFVMISSFLLQALAFKKVKNPLNYKSLSGAFWSLVWLLWTDRLFSAACITSITMIWLFGHCRRADTLSSLFNLEQGVWIWFCSMHRWVHNSAWFIWHQSFLMSLWVLPVPSSKYRDSHSEKLMLWSLYKHFKLFLANHAA